MRFRLPLPAVCLVALALSLAFAQTARAQLVALPPAPELSGAGYQLILDYEVGGGRSYYQARLARPSWPGFQSGVTVGVGYDCGYNSAAVIRSDWNGLEENTANRLSETAGVTGRRAQSRAVQLRDILIGWQLAEGVFQRVTVTRFYGLATRTFPGVEGLAPNAQAALLSLVFNRGSSLTGPRRGEMRAIRVLVPRRDYAGIAAELRKMKRHWRGTEIETGMSRRREAEARLVETCR